MVLYLEASTTKEEDKECTSLSSTLSTRILIHSSERTSMWKTDHGAIFAFYMEQAQEMGFEFFQTLNSCAFCCSRVCMECLVSMFLCMFTGTCRKTNGAVLHTSVSKAGRRTVEEKQSLYSSNSGRNRAQCRRKLLAKLKHQIPNGVHTTRTEVADLQKRETAQTTNGIVDRTSHVTFSPAKCAHWMMCYTTYGSRMCLCASCQLHGHSCRAFDCFSSWVQFLFEKSCLLQ